MGRSNKILIDFRKFAWWSMFIFFLWKFGSCINVCLILVCSDCEFLSHPAIRVSNQRVRSINLTHDLFLMAPFT